jgi:hypothetical protein
MTWERLGDRGKGLNWYNFGPIVSRPGEDNEGGQNVGHIGWTGIDMSEWTTAKYDLSEIAKDPRADQVRFRIAFSSDGSNPVGANYDGFAFDDFTIKSKSRLVLLEHFTNAPSRVEENKYLNALEDQVNQMPSGILLRDFDPKEVISIHYQLNSPLVNPIFDNYRDPRSRVQYYDFFNPNLKTMVDGTNYPYNIGGNTINLDHSDLISATLREPKFDIQATILSSADDVLNIQASVTSRTEIPNDRIVVHAAVIEREIVNTFNIDGIFSFRNVLKKMIPDATGTEFHKAWNPGDTEVLTLNWDLKQDYIKLYDSMELGVIVFVQDKNSREIYQAAYIKAPPKYLDKVTSTSNILPEFNDCVIYPVPVKDHFTLEFGKALEKDYYYKIVELRGIKLLEGKLERGMERIVIDAEKLPLGVNILIITDKSGGIIRKKFLVTR